MEQWYTLSSAIVGKAGKDSKCDLPMLRVKARYQSVQVLPMDLYQDFIEVGVMSVVWHMQVVWGVDGDQ